MPSSGLQGPFVLDSEGIDNAITRKSAGAYALGKNNTNGDFIVKYVGRSDTDVNGRLKAHIGKHPLFKFDYFGSPKAAFEKECKLYHDFNPSDNIIHPDRPENANWKCPVCDKFD